MLVALRTPRFRWEALLAAAAAAVCAYPAIRAQGAADLDEAFYAVAPGAFAFGMLAVMLLDIAHARLARQALSDVRDAVSIPLCVLAAVAAVAALVAWLA